MVIINAFSSVFYLCWINLSIIFLSSVPYIMCLSLNHLHAYIIIPVISAIGVYWFPFSKFRSDLLEKLITDKIVLSLDTWQTRMYMYLVHKLSITYIFDHPSIFTRFSSTNISLTKCLYLLWICLHILSIFCIHFHIDTWDLFGNCL